MDNFLKVPESCASGASSSPTSSVGSNAMEDLVSPGAAPSHGRPSASLASHPPGYRESLAEEKKRWEELYRKHKRFKKKVQRLQDKVHPTIPREEVLAALSEEDRRFVEARPDYAAFGTLLENLWKERLVALELQERVLHGLESVKKGCEELADKLAREILRADDDL